MTWAEEEKPAKDTEKEQPVRRRARNILKVNRRKYLGGGSDQLCHVTSEVVPTTAPRAVGVFLPATPGHCLRPSEQASSMCLMGITLTVVNQKDIWDVFSKRWPQYVIYKLRELGQIGDFSLGFLES